MGFVNVPARWVDSRGPIGLLVIIGSGSLLDERDAPEGGDLVSPPFEDGRLGGDNLRRLCVVDTHLLSVEHCKLPDVTLDCLASPSKM